MAARKLSKSTPDVPQKPAEKRIGYSDELGEALDLARGFSNLLSDASGEGGGLDWQACLVLWSASERLIKNLETVIAAFDEK